MNTYFVSKRFLQSDQVGANDSLAETSIAESAELVNRFRFSYKINKFIHLRNISYKIPITNNIEMITMSSFKHAGLIISIITSLISCTHNKNYTTTFQPELAKAEAIMYRYPDSALHILQGIQPDMFLHSPIQLRRPDSKLRRQ